ncbi:sporulation-control protein [Desulfocicer vacuolatum DSM 3385]|uniref:Sporulation-control protein n=1 Tax=Desulfocicer vacuolatum DSM 3385 TaxID=1121400 RepID=A0A1W2DT42_9BACT|nr:sporulation protein [Desulfocicer vacuolatum]SMD00640.1 sporulation-control protein [Desulfocicer vacuolatum DSM 3385]
MSFFKNILSKVGIGSATVETELFNNVFVPGQPVEGVVNITGGKVTQDIDTVYIKIKSTYEDEVEIGEDDEETEVDVTRTAEIMRLQISEPFTLNPEESVSFDLNFTLPWDTPATAGKTVTWVETGLDIKMAIDPGDKDYLNVTPHPLAERVLDAAMELGFEISEVVCEPAPAAMDMRVPFVQEFELKPVKGSFKNRLDEIELVFKPFEDSIQIFMEVDRKAKGVFGHLSEMMGTDETMVNFLVQKKDLPDLTGKMNDIIEEYCA